MRRDIKRETDSWGQDLPEKTSERTEDLNLALKNGYVRKINKCVFIHRAWASFFKILLGTRYTYFFI